MSKKKNPTSYNIKLYEQFEIEKSIFQEIKGLNLKRCVFCEPHNKKILLESDNYWVTFDSSPLTEGHLLIHSKLHLGCTGEQSNDNILELIYIKNLLEKTTRKIYGKCSFFEHGRAGHCGITYGLDQRVCHHFHLHVLPIDVDIKPVVEKLLERINVNNFEELVDLYNRHGHYLYFEDNKSHMAFFPASGELPSHYLRTVISVAQNTLEKADWQNYSNLSELNNAKHKYYNQLLILLYGER